MVGEVCIYFMLLELTLPTVKACMRIRSRSCNSISHGNGFKIRGTGNPISRYSRNLKLFTLVVTDPEALQKNVGWKRTLL